MAKLTFNALEYSRTAGMITVSGKGYLETAKALLKEEGFEGIEHDADNSEYVLTYNKAIIDQAKVKQVFKSVK